MEKSIYSCIDLKSFYASVEAAERKLDPFKENLVVADPSRGRGAICLAVTPTMKSLGIKNRCRLFEIPETVTYITAKPRMKLYMEYSARIYSIYLNYVSKEDIHVYSIDECFLDFTPYLHTYGKTPKEMAVMLMDAVRRETGICATAGIGTNLFLAKVALDITAKHSPDHIGYLDEKEFKRTIWHHRPITDIWNIGKGIAARLSRYGIYDLYGTAHMDEKLLYKEFGVNAEFLIDHAHGREPCTIKEIHDYESKSHSVSQSQILFEDYSYDNALLVLKEMTDALALELRSRHLTTDSISMSVAYSKRELPPSGGTRKLSERTDSYRELSHEFERFYHQTVQRGIPIRKISVGANHVEETSFRQLHLFSDMEKDEKEQHLQDAVLSIKHRFGKNAVVRGMSLCEKATARKRNTLIGGHNES